MVVPIKNFLISTSRTKRVCTAISKVHTHTPRRHEKIHKETAWYLNFYITQEPFSALADENNNEMHAVAASQKCDSSCYHEESCKTWPPHIADAHTPNLCELNDLISSSDVCGAVNYDELVCVCQVNYADELAFAGDLIK
jgi:hypothetical protein